MPVAEVGRGVGYFKYASCREGEYNACRFEGRGNPGDEDSGSKAGSNDGAGRFKLATGGSVGNILTLLGLSSMMPSVLFSRLRFLVVIGVVVDKSFQARLDAVRLLWGIREKLYQEL